SSALPKRHSEKNGAVCQGGRHQSQLSQSAAYVRVQSLGSWGGGDLDQGVAGACVHRVERTLRETLESAGQASLPADDPQSDCQNARVRPRLGGVWSPAGTSQRRANRTGQARATRVVSATASARLGSWESMEMLGISSALR